MLISFLARMNQVAMPSIWILLFILLVSYLQYSTEQCNFYVGYSIAKRKNIFLCVNKLNAETFNSGP